jgi:glutaredoxin
MRVVVYGANWCGPCQKVKEELDAAGIPYVFRDIDSNPTFKQYVADIQNTIPMVQVESNNGNCVTIGGYSETKETLDIFKFMLNEM